MGLYDDIYKALGVIEKGKAKSEVLELMKPPKKAKGQNMAHFEAFEMNAAQQADLLFLPTDPDGSKYALVVVDVFSRLADAQPIKNKEPATVLKAFKAIYARKVLSKPTIILQVDAGSEFKGVVKKWFNDQKVAIRVGKPGRSRQQALAERMNFLLGKMIGAKQNQIELSTGQPSTAWTALLPKIMSIYNREMRKKIKKRPTVKSKMKSPTCKGDACVMFQVGTLVHAVLDKPTAITTGKRMIGGFRAGDLRWEINPRKIVRVFINPGQPPMYRLQGRKNVAYTKNQLLLYKPSKKVIKYTIDKILDKKKIGGKIQYLVKYKGYDEPEWHPYTVLVQDVPHLLREFNQKLKKKIKPKTPRVSATTRYKGKIEKFVGFKKEYGHQYLVKWKGKSSSENTWVPRRDMLIPKWAKAMGFGSNKKQNKRAFDLMETRFARENPGYKNK